MISSFTFIQALKAYSTKLVFEVVLDPHWQFLFGFCSSFLRNVFEE